MSVRRTLSIARRTFRELRNDKRTLALMFVAPVIAMFVFGIAFSGDVRDVRVVVVNDDKGFRDPGTNITVSISKDIISNLKDDILTLEYVEDVEDGIHRVENGEAYGVIIFPKHFTRDLYKRIRNPSFLKNAIIKVKLDKSNVNVANAIIKNVSDAVIETMRKAGSESPIILDTDNPIYGENAEFMDFFVPGIMSYVVFFLTALLTLITFVGERTSGNLERLLSTPLKEAEIVFGYAIAFSIIGTLQTIILLAIGITVFNIMIVGNIILAFVVIALLAIVSLSLGILLSSLAKREAQAIQFLPFIVLPTFLLAGIFWPLEAIPSWIRPASYLIPPTYSVNACRSVMLRGWGLEKIWTDIAALVGFASVFLIAAIWSLKRKA